MADNATIDAGADTGRQDPSSEPAGKPGQPAGGGSGGRRLRTIIPNGTQVNGTTLVFGVAADGKPENSDEARQLYRDSTFVVRLGNPPALYNRVILHFGTQERTVRFHIDEKNQQIYFSLTENPQLAGSIADRDQVWVEIMSAARPEVGGVISYYLTFYDEGKEQAAEEAKKAAEAQKIAENARQSHLGDINPVNMMMGAAGTVIGGVTQPFLTQSMRRDQNRRGLSDELKKGAGGDKTAINRAIEEAIKYGDRAGLQEALRLAADATQRAAISSAINRLTVRQTSAQTSRTAARTSATVGGTAGVRQNIEVDSDGGEIETSGEVAQEVGSQVSARQSLTVKQQLPSLSAEQKQTAVSLAGQAAAKSSAVIQAAAQADLGGTAIYDNPANDPAIRASEGAIEEQINIALEQSGLQGRMRQELEAYLRAEVPNLVWRQFAAAYPEKAAEYAERMPALENALAENEQAAEEGGEPPAGGEPENSSVPPASAENAANIDGVSAAPQPLSEPATQPATEQPAARQPGNAAPQQASEVPAPAAPAPRPETKTGIDGIAAPPLPTTTDSEPPAAGPPVNAQKPAGLEEMRRNEEVFNRLNLRPAAVEIKEREDLEAAAQVGAEVRREAKAAIAAGGEETGERRTEETGENAQNRPAENRGEEEVGSPTSEPPGSPELPGEAPPKAPAPAEPEENLPKPGGDLNLPPEKPEETAPPVGGEAAAEQLPAAESLAEPSPTLPAQRGVKSFDQAEAEAVANRVVNEFLNSQIAIWVWAPALPSFGLSILVGAIVLDFLWAMKDSVINRALKNNSAFTKFISLGVEIKNLQIKFSASVKLQIAAMNALVIGTVVVILVMLLAIIYAGCNWPLPYKYDPTGRGSVIGLAYPSVCKTVVGGLAGVSGTTPNAALTAPGGGTAGGACNVLPSGDASPAQLSLTCFAPVANQASLVASKESGGTPTVPSGTDICTDAGGNKLTLNGKPLSVSWGLFQINITSHQVAGLNCPAAFTYPPGLKVKEYDASNHQCNVVGAAAIALYNQCVAAVEDPTTNINLACQIYKNQGWGAWGAAAQACVAAYSAGNNP